MGKPAGRPLRLAVAVIVIMSICAVGAARAPQAALAGPAGAARQIPLGGTGGPQTGAADPSGDGDVTQVEFPGQEDEADGPGPYPGTIVDRGLSSGSGKGVAVQS